MRGLDDTLCRPPEGINDPSATAQAAADKAVADSDDPTAVAGFVDEGSGCMVLPTPSAQNNGRPPNARATTGDGSGNDAAHSMPPLEVTGTPLHEHLQRADAELRDATDQSTDVPPKKARAMGLTVDRSRVQPALPRLGALMLCPTCAQV